MRVYPAIDLMDGCCVRLTQGQVREKTVYSKDPVAVAEGFIGQGAHWLHMVDLDGAFSGQSKNLDVVRRVAHMTGVSVQTSGGIRSMEDIIYRLEEVGAARVILGTLAVEQPEVVAQAVARYAECIAVGIDARDGIATTRGWVCSSGMTALELAGRIRDLGVRTVIYTDIGRDAMLSGNNLEQTAAMAERSGMDIIASGGIGSLQDILDVLTTGAKGVIVGKALYTGAVTLDAVRAQKDLEL